MASTSLEAAGGSSHWVAVPGSSQALTEIAAGVYLLSISLAVGVLNAACMTA